MPAAGSFQPAKDGEAIVLIGDAEAWLDSDPVTELDAGASVLAAAGVPAVLVVDVDRGGSFAAAYGTWALLPEHLRNQLRGFVLNCFRGDKALIKNPTTLTPTQASEMCTSCHNRSSHSEWEGSKHDSRSVGCTSCHSVHAAKSEGGQLKTRSISENCATCHKNESNKVRKSSHMPVAEGKMECSSCHNPHGSTNLRQLRVGNWINEIYQTTPFDPDRIGG